MKIEILTETGYVEYDLEPTTLSTQNTSESEYDESDPESELDIPDPDLDMEEEQFIKGNHASKWNEIRILTISNWPETAMKLKKKCWKERNGLFSITVCGKTKLPHSRRCKKKFLLKYRILNPNEKVRKDIESCLKKATIAAAGAFLLGGIAAVKVTFKTTLNSCLKEKLGSVKNFLDYKFDTEKECGSWSPI